MTKRLVLENLRKIVGPIELGFYLRNARELAELSQTEFGKKIGKSKQFISDIENMRRSITFDTILSWSEASGESKRFLIEKFYEYTLEKAGIKGKVVKVLTLKEAKELKI